MVFKSQYCIAIYNVSGQFVPQIYNSVEKEMLRFNTIKSISNNLITITPSEIWSINIEILVCSHIINPFYYFEYLDEIS